MQAYDEIVSIVPRGSGELVTGAAKEAGAFGGTILMGRGTASNSILQILGFGDSAKDIVLIVSEKEKSDAIRDAIVFASKDKKRPFGVLFRLETCSFFKSVNSEQSGNAEDGAEADGSKEENMNGNNTHKLLTVIVNRGYADDAMDAARKAGAGGGTIINARGTAREGDATFFGMEIVPEKDMILIVAENSKVEGIMDAIKNLPCLSKPGSGVAFASPAADFTVLGKPKN